MEFKSREIVFLVVLSLVIASLGMCSFIKGKTVSKGPQSESDYKILVHVSGYVRSPGVYWLPGSSRVCDAVAAAGGELAEADIHKMNLAAFLSDGQKVAVPGRDSPSAQEPGQENGLVNINTADQHTLETLPNIGPARAQSIIEYREAHGSFSALEELMCVTGIGPSIFESIIDLITY